MVFALLALFTFVKFTAIVGEIETIGDCKVYLFNTQEIFYESDNRNKHKQMLTAVSVNKKFLYLTLKAF